MGAGNEALEFLESHLSRSERQHMRLMLAIVSSYSHIVIVIAILRSASAPNECFKLLPGLMRNSLSLYLIAQ